MGQMYLSEVWKQIQNISGITKWRENEREKEISFLQHYSSVNCNKFKGDAFSECLPTDPSRLSLFVHLDKSLIQSRGSSSLFCSLFWLHLYLIYPSDSNLLVLEEFFGLAIFPTWPFFLNFSLLNLPENI